MHYFAFRSFQEMRDYVTDTQSLRATFAQGLFLGSYYGVLAHFLGGRKVLWIRFPDETLVQAAVLYGFIPELAKFSASVIFKGGEKEDNSLSLFLGSLREGRTSLDELMPSLTHFIAWQVFSGVMKSRIKNYFPVSKYNWGIISSFAIEIPLVRTSSEKQSSDDEAGDNFPYFFRVAVIALAALCFSKQLISQQIKK